MVVRILQHQIEQYLFQRKTIVIYGARQVGKTTLVEQITENHQQATLFLNGDDADIRELFTDANATRLQPVIGSHKIVVLDEAQRIPETGLAIKIIHDNPATGDRLPGRKKWSAHGV
ncbi:MAG: AAA family ATPase [Bacteroidetes bacterium]|nr:AAA family ATPase [Bacteroidota bacterium]